MLACFSSILDTGPHCRTREKWYNQFRAEKLNRNCLIKIIKKRKVIIYIFPWILNIRVRAMFRLRRTHFFCVCKDMRNEWKFHSRSNPPPHLHPQNVLCKVFVWHASRNKVTPHPVHTISSHRIAMQIQHTTTTNACTCAFLFLSKLMNTFFPNSIHTYATMTTN